MVFYMFQQTYAFCRCRFFWCKFNLTTGSILHKVISYISFILLNTGTSIEQHFIGHVIQMLQAEGDQKKHFFMWKPSNQEILCICCVYIQCM